MRFLVDTNVALRLVATDDPLHESVVRAMQILAARADEPVVVPQVAYEFWSTATRPIDVNGFGWSTAQTRAVLDDLLASWDFLGDTPAVFTSWLELVTRRGVSGKQVHDARLVATMHAHGLKHLLTLNGADFKRFSEVTIIRPGEVAT